MTRGGVTVERPAVVPHLHLYQLHRPTFDIPLDETIRALDDLVRLTGYRVIVRDNLVCWNYATGAMTIENNIASSWEVTPDGKEYTFALRQGLKWSDGEPFTADDFVFYYEDILLNEEITPTFPSWLSSGGEPGVYEKVDDHTVKVWDFATGDLLATFKADSSDVLTAPLTARATPPGRPSSTASITSSRTRPRRGDQPYACDGKNDSSS